ncbi:hypothetical protein F4808DRAFT_305736 [Astrocystis sublimbata]|nr:hypothetical protein F4808DRAFT_305736 [Astrocystis sublimbata]
MAKSESSNNRQRDFRADDSVSDAEVDDLLNEMDYRQTAPQSRRARYLAAFRSHRWFVDTFLLLVIVALLLQRGWTSQPTPQKYQGNGDITGYAPQFSQRLTRFSPDPRFVPDNTSEFFSEKTKKSWLGIVPKGLGYLEVEDPEQYEFMPNRLKSFEEFVVTTSMTHQLHCLYAIAEAYSILSSNSTRAPSQEPWHLTHCFDYLRQSIMCCGDVAVEGQQTTFPEGHDGSDGWDATHVCKDYDEVMAHLLDHRANNEVWI